MPTERTDERILSDLSELAKQDGFSHWFIEEDQNGGVSINRSFGRYKDCEVNWPCGESEDLHEAINEFLDEKEAENG